MLTPVAPRSRWTSLDDPLLAPVLEALTADYVGWYGPGAHDEMAEHPAEVFTPPDGGVLALVDGSGIAVAAGAFRARDPGIGLGPERSDPPAAAASSTGRVAEFKRMWTSPAHRRLGLARRVLAELEDAARTAGYDEVYLATGWRQDVAIRLYLATGYQPLFDLDGDPSVPFARGFTKQLGTNQLSTGQLSTKRL